MRESVLKYWESMELVMAMHRLPRPVTLLAFPALAGTPNEPYPKPSILISSQLVYQHWKKISSPLPGLSGQSWHLIRGGGLVIVSHHPLNNTTLSFSLTHSSCHVIASV